MTESKDTQGTPAGAGEQPELKDKGAPETPAGGEAPKISRVPPPAKDPGKTPASDEETDDDLWENLPI